MLTWATVLPVLLPAFLLSVLVFLELLDLDLDFFLEGSAELLFSFFLPLPSGFFLAGDWDCPLVPELALSCLLSADWPLGRWGVLVSLAIFFLHAFTRWPLALHFDHEHLASSGLTLQSLMKWPSSPQMKHPENLEWCS